MIRPLRKRHFIIWLVLAILVPAGFVFAYLVIPDQVINDVELSPNKQPPPYENKIFNVEDEKFLLNVRQENDQKQIELVIKQPLTRPSSALYLSNEDDLADIERIRLLGTIGTKGIYRFNVSGDGQYKSLLFYDSIKDEYYHILPLN